MSVSESVLVTTVAPHSEEKVRAFMESEAAKYQPNWCWKFNRWPDRHPYLLLAGFVMVACAVPLFSFLISGKRLSQGVLNDAFLVALIVVALVFLILSKFERDPARWGAPKAGSITIALDTHLARIRELDPSARYEIEVLEYTNLNDAYPLATVIWLVLTNVDGTLHWRGVLLLGRA